MSREWYRDDALWEDAYPYMFPEERIAQGGEEIDQVVALAGVSRGAALDLCCGPGRHAIPLARRGFRVTAVDRSPFLLAKARTRAADERIAAIEWVEADMREFGRPGAYDLAISLYTSFGYFEAPADNVRVLVQVRRSLRPGGALVLDLMGKEIIARKYEPTDSTESAAGGLVIRRRRVVRDWAAMENEWILLRPDGQRRIHFFHWIYSGQELRDLLLDAGFDAVELFGNLAGAEYGPEAQRLVAVARAAVR